MSPEVEAADRGRATRPGPAPGALGVAFGRGLVLFALWGVAVAQPVLDLFGNNPEFFVASELSRREIVAFALLVVGVVPLLLVALETVVRLVSDRVATGLHRALVFLLALAFGLGLAVDLGGDGLVLTLAVAAALAAGITLVERRWESGRLALRYLALAPLAFLAMFLFASPSADLLWADQATVEEGVPVGDPAPVVMVVFDELPLASLLRPDGTFNERRFPNFARLAAASTWYPEAVSASAQTTEALPSLLTGRLRVDGALPTSASHPDNLFTLLGGSYDLQVTETVTGLCPDSACGDGRSEGGGALSGAVLDAAVAYAHLVVPPSQRDHLPAINETWGGFVGGGTDGPEIVDEDTRRAYMGDLAAQAAQRSPAGLGSTLSAAVETAKAGERSLVFIHDAFIPHRPWRNTPTGARYEGTTGDLGTVATGWPEDPAVVRLGFQRHLLSVGYADLVLGRLIDRLQDQGHWRDALVLVMADHGVAFDPGSALRPANADTLNEVHNVPLFVKAPGQVEGRVDDRDAVLIDVLPTIVDLLDVDVDWTFDGRSLAGPPGRPDEVEAFPEGMDPRTEGFDGVLAAAARNRTDYLPYGEGWLGVAQVGGLGGRVGRPATPDGDAVGLSWALDDADALVLDDADRPRAGTPPHRPVVLTGTVRSSGPTLPDELLVGLNGHLAGVAVLAGDGDERTFKALVAEQYFVQGDNEVSLLRPDGTAPDAPLRLVHRT